MGDALGAAVEFDSLAGIRREHGPEGLQDYARAGEPDEDVGPYVRASLEERATSLLRDVNEVLRLPGAPPVAPPPANATTEQAMLHILRHGPSFLAMLALELLVAPVGLRLEYGAALWHSVTRMRTVRGTRRAAVSALPVRSREQIVWAAAEHSDAAVRAVCRQCTGEIALDDDISLLAFDAAGSCGALGRLPRHGAPSRRLALSIFRDTCDGRFDLGAAAVGLILLDDRDSFGRLEAAAARRTFSNAAELRCAASALAVLDYARGLPILCRVGDQPAHRLADAHFCSEGEAHHIVDFGKPFPFRLDERHEALRLVGDAQLKFHAAANGAEYLHSTEAVIELASRPMARRSPWLFRRTLRVAHPVDAVRILCALSNTDRELAKSVARSCTAHPSWEVRLAAAAALLPHGPAEPRAVNV